MAERPAPPELLEFLSPYPAEVVETFLAARSFLLELFPTANEFVWDATQAVTVGFGFTDRWQDGFVHLPVYPKHVNLGFNRGASLTDPTEILVGNGSTVRHIKISGANFFTRVDVLDLIHQARDRAVDQGSSAGATFIRSMAGPKRRPSP